MTETRIEILVDGVWKTLKLRNASSIKYNKLVNRVAEINKREISHSNTFSLPQVHENIVSLGINVFNHGGLAMSLNSKYPAKYYVEEKLIQEGFLVINNTYNNEINVNFIDTSLDIIDKWGTITFRELILDETLSIPADYQSAIDELKNYVLKQNEQVVPLSEVGTRGYNLALFPNSLNTIGENFQLDSNGIRLDNIFNPYQSRPIFSAKSVFDLACEAYGYTPIFDDSVDWDKVSENFIVSEGLAENFKEEGAENVYGTVSIPSGAKVETDPGVRVTSVIVAPVSRSFTPNEIPNWVSPDPLWETNYLTENCVFVPDDLTIGSGVVKFSIVAPDPTEMKSGNCYAVWENSTVGGNVIFEPIVTSNESEASGGLLEFEISKSELRRQPAGTNFLIGIVVTVDETSPTVTNNTLISCRISETFLPVDAISYDEFGQYIDQNIDMTYAAPSKTVKELLLSLMAKDGILMDIDGVNKEITFFNYGIYTRAIEEGNFEDWSKYIRKYSPFRYNTDYGTSYAKDNEIGLSNPYSGNTFTLKLINQGRESKLKDYTTNYSNLFKDVSKVIKIPNSKTPYIEFQNLGFGLVRNQGTLGALTQVRADGTNLGEISNVANISNIDFTDLPSGITDWYRLVDEAIKAEPVFLIPVDVIKNVDIKKPVYIEELQGFWIIEEIAEYENAQTHVTVKLIRNVDAAEYNDDFNNDFNT